MNILVNGQRHSVTSLVLADVLVELELDRPAIATAVNEAFVPAANRAAMLLQEGDRLEVLAPMQGG